MSYTYDCSYFSCEYTIATADGWGISVKMIDCDQWSTCKKRLRISFGGFEVIAIGRNVTVNKVPLDPTEGYVNGRKYFDDTMDLLN